MDASKMKGFILLICVILSVLHHTNAQRYKVCAYPNQYRYCSEVTKGNSVVSCLKVQDSVDCAWNIQEGNADFGSFYPEQAILASKFIDNSATVISELRELGGKDSKHSYSTVVVVKKDFSGSVKDLGGKKYCHLGFDGNVAKAMTLRARQEFENAIVNIKDKCQENKSIVEKEVEALSNYFGPSCRPGQWSEDEEVETNLKNKFRDLCELCDNPATCSYNDNTDAGKNALSCLTQKNADVAYTTQQAALNFTGNKADYKLLCRDGSFKDMDYTGDDCTWRNEPWVMILGNSEKAADIKNKFTNGFIESSFILGKQSFDGRAKVDEWKIALRRILASDDDQKRFNIIDDAKKPSEYFQINKQEVSDTSEGSCQMKWCTISNEEHDKCNWLKEAANIIGIKPPINCIPTTNVYECLKTIKDNRADIMAIDSHYGFIARKYGHLRTLMNIEENPDSTSKIFTLVKSDSGINAYADMKGKKACFPEYRGLAWLAYIAKARQHNALPDNCDYGKSIGEFFSEVCAPGVEDAFHAKSLGADENKLCSLCKKTDSDEKICAANHNNRYFNNSGALKCLNDGTADVAFVKLHDLSDDTTFNNVKVLCKNNDLRDILDMNDVKKLSEDCALIAAVNSELVSKSNNKGNADFIQVLERIDRYFGKSSSDDETFNVFAAFKGKYDLLFKSTTLDITRSVNNKYVENYLLMFDLVYQCFVPTTTPTTSTTATTTLSPETTTKGASTLRDITVLSTVIATLIYAVMY